MAEVKVTFDTNAINRSLDQVALDIFNQRQDLLEVIGVQILSFAQEAYDVKATGAMGDDGIQWDPLQVSTILDRLHRAGHVHSPKIKDSKPHASIPVRSKQRVVLQVKRKVKGNEVLFDALAAAGVDFHDHKTGKKLAAGKRNKTKAVLVPQSEDSLKNKVNVSGYDIGVDTGLQRAAASPAYRGDHQVFKKDEVGVTVGFNMSYSKYFDHYEDGTPKRKLMPDILPTEWFEEIERLTVKHMEVTLENSFHKQGLS